MHPATVPSRSVFGNDSTHLFTTQSHRALDMAELKEQDLVILNALPDVPSGLTQALTDFVANGASVAVFPPAQGDPSRYADLFAAMGAAPAHPRGYRPGEGGPHRPGGTLLPRHLPEHAAQRGTARRARALAGSPCRR